MLRYGNVIKRNKKFIWWNFHYKRCKRKTFAFQKDSIREEPSCNHDNEVKKLSTRRFINYHKSRKIRGALKVWRWSFMQQFMRFMRRFEVESSGRFYLVMHAIFLSKFMQFNLKLKHLSGWSFEVIVLIVSHIKHFLSR